MIAPEPTYITWLIGAVLVLLLWLTWRRPNKKRLIWRMLASIVAGASLVMLVYTPTYERAIDAGAAILVTEGSEADSINALLQAVDPDPLIYSYNTETEGAEPVSNLYALLQEQPHLQTIHVFGNGLEPQELEVLKSIKVIAHLSEPKSGIINVSWPASVKLGDAIEVAGQYKSLASEASGLYLLAGGEIQDSVHFTTDGMRTFQLNFSPKQEGRFVYYILTKQEGQTDTIGQVPIHVLPAEKLKILILASSPSFEFKFLKNHLGELQHQVALRSKVSKSINQIEWINMPKIGLGRITTSLLAKFDLVITEPQALQDLTNTERAALQQDVTQSGLGILTIRGEQQPGRSTSFFTGFPTKRVSQQESRTVTSVWSGREQVETIAAPYALVKEDALTGLIQEKGGRALVGAKKEGRGTVGISLIPQTFSWQLEGKDEVYASYWAFLLSELAKKEEQTKFWKLPSPQVVKANRPVSLLYTDYTFSSSEVLPEAVVRSITDSAGTALSFKQNPLLPEQFTSTVWPQLKGWHVIETPDAPNFYFYVQDSTDWSAIDQQQKRKTTQEFVAAQEATTLGNRSIIIHEKVPVYWFFLLFLLSSSFLWMEEKF